MKLPVSFLETSYGVKVQKGYRYIACSGTEILTWADEPGDAMAEAADKLVARWSDPEELLRQLTCVSCYPATFQLIEALPTTNWDIREDGVADLLS